VVGLVGSDPARVRRRADAAGISQAFTDLDDAIARTGAIAVTVATPPHTHAPLVLAALARGCHVLCEKPFASNAAEARLLLEAAERAGVVHLLGNQFRLRPERVMIARAIADGAIGTPRLLTIAQYAGLVASPEARMPKWWFDKEAGGGWLGASGSHVIDQTRSWLGEFTSVSATLPTVSNRSDVAEDSFVIRFELTSGAQGILQQTGGAWGAHAAMTRVAGTAGTLWVESGQVWIADRDGTRHLPAPPDLLLPELPPSDDPMQQFLQLELPPARRLCEIWRARIEGRRLDAPELATFADGVACMEVIDAIRASAAANGELVSLPQATD
jgi:predicted dehydrogenase